MAGIFLFVFVSAILSVAVNSPSTEQFGPPELNIFSYLSLGGIFVLIIWWISDLLLIDKFIRSNREYLRQYFATKFTRNSANCH